MAVRKIYLAFLGLLLGWTLAGQDGTLINIQVAAGLRDAEGVVGWMQPGSPFNSENPRSLVFQFLASRDCYLYALALPDRSSEAVVLWPDVSNPEIMRAKAGRTISLDFNLSEMPALERSGTLAVLVFSKPPLKFHASLSKARPDLARVEREIREYQRENSRFAHSASDDLVLIAGTLRDAAGEVRGLETDIHSFWAGMYEWHTSSTD